MVSINNEDFDIKQISTKENQVNKQQQGMTYLGLARLSNSFIKNFLNSDHAGPYKKQLFIKSLSQEGISIQILPENLLFNKEIDFYYNYAKFKCSMKDINEFFIPFLQNIQSWNIDNLSITVDRYYWNPQLQHVKMVHSDPLFQIFNRIYNQIIPKIETTYNNSPYKNSKYQISNFQHLLMPHFQKKSFQNKITSYVQKVLQNLNELTFHHNYYNHNALSSNWPKIQLPNLLQIESPSQTNKLLAQCQIQVNKTPFTHTKLIQDLLQNYQFIYQKNNQKQKIEPYGRFMISKLLNKG